MYERRRASSARPEQLDRDHEQRLAHSMANSTLPPDMEARAQRLGEMSANSMIDFTIAMYREKGLFTPDKLYTMTVDEVDDEDKVRFLMHIVRCSLSDR